MLPLSARQVKKYSHSTRPVIVVGFAGHDNVLNGTLPLELSKLAKLRKFYGDE